MAHLYFVLLMTLPMLIQTSKCPELYRRYSVDHTFCKPKNPQCNFVSKGLKTGERDIILREHNLYRSRVANGKEHIQNMPSASNMLQLEWDDTLAGVAQKHADQCAFDHDCNECRRVRDFSAGQNLYQRKYTGSLRSVDWKAAVKGWYDEVSMFNKNHISPFVFGAATGHFTQAIWAETWRIGCGYSMVKTGSNSYKELYTCNYGPAGNMDSGEMYKRGHVCSNCPTNSCCDKSCTDQGKPIEYPGLCKMLWAEPPEYPSKDDSFFKCTFNDEDDCQRNVVGANKWQVAKTLSGNYLTIVLKGGEKSTLTFSNDMKPSSQTFCVIYYYRKGANVDGKESVEDSVKEIYVIPEYDNHKIIKAIPGVSKQFSKRTMTFGWKSPTQTSFEFSVPAGKPAQYFEIRDIIAKNAVRGIC